MIKKLCPNPAVRAYLCAGLALMTSYALEAQTAAETPESSDASGDDVVVLSPFTVEGDADRGYMASSSLAGTRLRTELKDIGTSISVLTKEFLDDIGATDNLSALTYATNMEVGGVSGNFQDAPNTGSFGQTSEEGFHFAPNSTTRVRGLVSADNTRNYFRTAVAWDGYNVSRIDILRGPNSILFGLGSPGGVVNATTDSANLRRTSGEATFKFDEYGSIRGSLNYNQVLVRDVLAVRFALLNDREKFKQDPAYDDEDRVFVAAKFAPKMFNNRDTTFDISVDYEWGDGTSNRPRTAPPLDNITAWIEPVSTKAIQLPAGTNFMGYENGIIPAYTQFANQEAVTFLGDVARTFSSALTTWADAFGPRLYVNSLSDNGQDFWRQGRVWVEGVRLANGSTYIGNPQTARRLFGYGNAFQDIMIKPFNRYLEDAGHPLGAYFIPLQVTDPSVYDFYNQLLDGPNKKEWNSFHQFRAVLSNTFLKQKVGYELSYFRENSTRGQTTLLSDTSRIFIDTQVEDIEGNPNPDFGRPFAQETTYAANRINKTDIEGFRGSIYADYNFDTGNNSGVWWRELLGRHLLNAAFTRDETSADNRSFARHVLGPEFVEVSPDNPVFNNRTRVGIRNYLGDSLVGRTSLAGANIGNLSRYVIPEGGDIDLRWFDIAWNAPASVATSAAWTNPLGQKWEQAANPANYVGWTNSTYSFIDALSGSEADYEAATRQGTLQYNKVDSKILTWQGHMFKGLLVGTYGWREDESTSARYNSESLPVPYNGANLDPSVYTLDNPETVRDSAVVRSHNYSIVAHLNRLPWIGKSLPLDMSLSYNEGENFNPTSGRRDVNGDFLPQPQGSTKEYGVLLSTKDNRYSLRVFKFETGVLYSTSTQIANANFRLNQFLSPDSVLDVEEGLLRENYEALPTPPAFSIDDQENIYAPAWRQFEKDLVAAFPGLVSSWLTAGTYAPSNRETFFGLGFANTEDNVSKGYEIEFTANPTRQLRLTLNASKTNAVRTNVPGDSTRALYEFIQSHMVNPDGSPTAAGMLRGADWQNQNEADVWYEQNYIDYRVNQQLNGQPAPELVEWRANALVNYTFTDGRLRGVGIGGAYRYEGPATIGFPYYFDEDGTVTLDIDHPFRRPSDGRADFWVRYRRSLSKGKVDWSVQLNIQNIFGDDKLIPVRANPDGTAANYRIQLGQSWKVSTTFAF